MSPIQVDGAYASPGLLQPFINGSSIVVWTAMAYERSALRVRESSVQVPALCNVVIIVTSAGSPTSSMMIVLRDATSRYNTGGDSILLASPQFVPWAP